jgi:hypothetical protein
MAIEVTTNSFGVIFFEFSIFDKSRQGKTIKKKLEKVAHNTVKPSELVVFYFVLILLRVGNPHR